MAEDSIPEENLSDGSGYIHNLAIDAVIFGFHERQLKVLLLEYKSTGLFALPGGFIKERENLNDAATRVVTERTSLQNIFLDQFYVFGDLSRYDPRSMKSIMVAKGRVPHDNHWLLQRFITVGYYALVDFTKTIPSPDAISDTCTWYDLQNLPALMQDHSLIIRKALDTLRFTLDQKLTGFNLLPENFTMGDLQAVYETILGKKLIRAAFQRKMLSLGILEMVAKKFTGKAHKAPYLYRFVERKSAL